MRLLEGAKCPRRAAAEDAQRGRYALSADALHVLQSDRLVVRTKVEIDLAAIVALDEAHQLAALLRVRPHAAGGRPAGTGASA